MDPVTYFRADEILADRVAFTAAGQPTAFLDADDLEMQVRLALRLSRCGRNRSTMGQAARR